MPPLKRQPKPLPYHGATPNWGERFPLMLTIHSAQVADRYTHHRWFPTKVNVHRCTAFAVVQACAHHSTSWDHCQERNGGGASPIKTQGCSVGCPKDKMPLRLWLQDSTYAFDPPTPLGSPGVWDVPSFIFPRFWWGDQWSLNPTLGLKVSALIRHPCKCTPKRVTSRTSFF